METEEHCAHHAVFLVEENNNVVLEGLLTVC